MPGRLKAKTSMPEPYCFIFSCPIAAAAKPDNEATADRVVDAIAQTRFRAATVVYGLLFFFFGVARLRFLLP